MPEILDEPNKFKHDLTYRQDKWANRHMIEKDNQPQLGILLEIFDKLDVSSIEGRYRLLQSHLGMIERYCNDIQNLVDLNQRLWVDVQASQDRYDDAAQYISAKEAPFDVIDVMGHEIDVRSNLRSFSTTLGELIAIKAALLSYTLFPSSKPSRKNIPRYRESKAEKNAFLGELQGVIEWRASTLESILIPEGISSESPFRSKELRDLIMHFDEKVDARYVQERRSSMPSFSVSAPDLQFVMPRLVDIPGSVDLQKLTATHGITDVVYLIAVSREIGARAERMGHILWRARVLSRRLWCGDA